MIDQEYLKECFDYDCDSGVLSWRVRPDDHFEDESTSRSFRKKYSGKSAGTIYKTHSGKRYIRVMLFRRLYRAHRVVWFLVYGEFPKGQIDHIDGDGLNNRIDNLRDVTHLNNMRNQRLHKRNTSCCSGVYFHKPTFKWCAQIGNGCKQVHLGIFEEKWDAICSRKSAECRYGYHPNHGTIRQL